VLNFNFPLRKAKTIFIVGKDNFFIFPEFIEKEGFIFPAFSFVRSSRKDTLVEEADSLKQGLKPPSAESSSIVLGQEIRIRLSKKVGAIGSLKFRIETAFGRELISSS